MKPPRAVNDDLIVSVEYANESSGGIIIADGSKRSQGEFYGIVESVGQDFNEDVKPGDKILFTRRGQTHEGIEIEKDGKRYLRLRREWVEAVIR